MKKWQDFINEVTKKHDTVARVICFKEEAKFLTIKRSMEEDTSQGYWDLPGGHIDDEDDSIEMGVIRELKEETNLESSIKDLVYIDKTENSEADSYFYATDRWSGSIKFNKNPKTGIIEHTDAKWVTIDELKNNKTFELRTFPTYLLDKAIEKLKISKT